MNHQFIFFRGLLACCAASLVSPRRGFRSVTWLACGVAWLLGTAGTSPVLAQVAYNEAISGDFSNSGLTPTLVALTGGSNLIFGTTGRVGATIDRDYFTINVPTGLAFASLVELPGTTIGGTLSFLGLQAGNQVTLPGNAATAAGLLGWTHYDSSLIGTDLLPLMAIPDTGSSGFGIPLGPGSYSFWVQELSVGTFNYGFNVGLVAVPEPSAYAIAGAALLLVVALRRRFSIPPSV